MCCYLFKQSALIHFAQDLVDVQYICYQEHYQEGALKAFHIHRHCYLEEQHVSGIVIQHELVPFLRLCLIARVMRNCEMILFLVVQKFQDYIIDFCFCFFRSRFYKCRTLIWFFTFCTEVSGLNNTNDFFFQKQVLWL